MPKSGTATRVDEAAEALSGRGSESITFVRILRQLRIEALHEKEMTWAV